MLRTLSLAAAGVALAFGGTATVATDAEANARACRTYASNAVRQNRTNLRRRCGYRGQRWTARWRSHFRWCMRTGLRAARRAHRIRARRLARCRFGGNKRAYCRSYASTAVRQFRANQRHRCGYFGTRWTPYRRGHFQWCMAVGRRLSRNETRIRRQRLRACR